MLDKVLVKVLKNLSPEDKKGLREALFANTSKDTSSKEESGKNVIETPVGENQGKGTNTEEKPNDENVETGKTEEQGNSTENVENTNESTNPNEEVAKGQEDLPPNGEETPTNEASATPTAQVEGEGNGIRIEDVVTKDDLQNALNAFEAKFKALEKENSDLKDELAKSNTELSKFKNGDFGNNTQKAPYVDNKAHYESFDDYAKNYK